MDNYFTLPKLMEMLCDFMIGFLGTTRFRPGWPGQNGKEIDDTQINFNELFWSVDSFGTLLINLMDNVLVLLVTIVQKSMDVKKCLRRIPIVNKNNKRHVDRVW